MNERVEIPVKPKVIAFDFGGVLAQEGFRNGLMAIAELHDLDGEEFFITARELAYRSGYVTGESSEAHFWQILRAETGIVGSDSLLRRQILDRFVLRNGMLHLVALLRNHHFGTAILSDQTNWLDELDARHPFFTHFDQVFNSYHMGKSKRDATLFTDVCRNLGIAPAELVFVDDSEGHVDRAKGCGVLAIYYQSPESLVVALAAATRLPMEVLWAAVERED